MAAIFRLTAVTCQELADVKAAKRKFVQDFRKAIMDNRIDGGERLDLLGDLDELEREINEAFVSAEEADYVEARTEYAKKRGWGARPHQYLREREQDIREMGGLAWLDENLEPAQRKAPVLAEAQVSPARK